MKLNLLSLKFSGDCSHLEESFENRNFKDSLPQIRAALVVGAIFYAAFGILDVLLMPENAAATLLIRFGIVIPACIGILLFSLSKSFERYLTPLMTCASIVAGGGIIWMIVIAPPSVSYTYYAGLLLVFIWSYTFARIPFLWASFANWVIVVLYEIVAIWIYPAPLSVLINNNFFFISANIMGMIACYTIEFQARRSFFLTAQLESERKNINSINRILENKTAEYQVVNRMLAQEINDREQAQRDLKVSEEQYRTLVETASDIIFRADNKGYITFINPAGLRITGYREEEMLGKHYLEMIHPDMYDDQEDMDFFRNQFVNHIQNTYFEYPISTKDGQKVWLGQNTQLVLREDKVVGFQAVARDLTDQKKMEAEIFALSITDQLTGLYNRRGFMVLTRQQLKSAYREKTKMLFLFADVDGLKWINDALGHGDGDNALIETATVLKETLRSSDIIARLGGDEFAALINNSGEANSGIITDRLQRLIDRRNEQENRRYCLSLSVGCSHYDPESPSSIEELMAAADHLMYEQKKKRRAVLSQSKICLVK